MIEQEIIQRFNNYSDLLKLLVYAIALKEEKYELLAVLDKVVDEEFREQVKTVETMIKDVDLDKLVEA